jgi:hypothetical protein
VARTGKKARLRFDYVRRPWQESRRNGRCERQIADEVALSDAKLHRIGFNQPDGARHAS